MSKRKPCLDEYCGRMRDKNLRPPFDRHASVLADSINTSLGFFASRRLLVKAALKLPVLSVLGCDMRRFEPARAGDRRVF